MAEMSTCGRWGIMDDQDDPKTVNPQPEYVVKRFRLLHKVSMHPNPKWPPNYPKWPPNYSKWPPNYLEWPPNYPKWSPNWGRPNACDLYAASSGYTNQWTLGIYIHNGLKGQCNWGRYILSEAPPLNLRFNPSDPRSPPLAHFCRLHF